MRARCANLADDALLSLRSVPQLASYHHVRDDRVTVSSGYTNSGVDCGETDEDLRTSAIDKSSSSTFPKESGSNNWATKFVPVVNIGGGVSSVSGGPRRDNLDQPLLHTSSAGGGLPRDGGAGIGGISHQHGHLGGVEAHGGGGQQYRQHQHYLETVNLDTMNGDLGMGVDQDVFMRDRSMRSQASSTRSSTRGSTISFHHINYVVNSKRMPWSKAVKKIVLNDVSGVIRPGMNAIMGPTGSGKSSLLDVLAGRKDPRYLQGDVLVDGAPQPDNFKCASGYVVQDDIVMGTLTVRENLRFSAALRLPSKTTEEDRKAKVNDVIEELGLLNVADSKIGNELIRGVSGGERKRTNIGMELITDPSVLFLDEPTTGLDAFTAGSVIKTLRNLALRGRTIIFSIHQPKYSIYKLFDTLTMVCKGQLVYHGPADNHPLMYFKSVGYVCENFNNPPDFFMDILHGEVKHGNVPEDDTFSNPNNDIESITEKENTLATGEHNGDDSIHTGESVTQISQRLILAWSNSLICQRVNQEVEGIYNTQYNPSNPSNPNSPQKVKVRKANHVAYPTNFWTQCWWMCWRTGVNLFRNPHSSVVQLAVYLFFALSVGTVYHPLDDSTESGIQNRMGLFFFSAVQMIFVNLSAIEIFIKERVIFIHENSSGYYRVSVYFIGKILCDMLPIKVMPVVLFMPMTYFMAGLRLDAGAFFFYELNLVLTTVAGCGIAFFVSASVSIFGVANILISIAYVIMMIFGGFLINVGTMGSWLQWVSYLSIFRYSLNGLAINEFKTLEFCPKFNYSSSNGTVDQQCITGMTYLSEQAILHTTDWHLWLNELGLGVISVITLALCYMQLRLMNKYK